MAIEDRAVHEAQPGATPADVDVLVTDAEAAPADLARLEDAGIEVVVA